MLGRGAGGILLMGPSVSRDWRQYRVGIRGVGAMQAGESLFYVPYHQRYPKVVPRPVNRSFELASCSYCRPYKFLFFKGLDSQLRLHTIVFLIIFFWPALCPALEEGVEVSAYPQQYLDPRRALVGASTTIFCQSPAHKSRLVHNRSSNRCLRGA